MSKKYFIFCILLLCTFSRMSVEAQNIPAFPGAEGHGRYTTGGRGGSVYHVTNLYDNAPGESIVEGSLRWALEQSGTKTIVFDVAGTIHLKQEMRTKRDNLTIAGQTSPGGICIAGWPFVINSNNVIVRYLRFRPGDVSRKEPDGLGGMDKKNIIVDHCSVSWSVDECISVYGMENLTVQWCIASEALRKSTHSKNVHCYGGNWGGKKVSYHHNLIAHCESRTPRLGPRAGTQQEEYMDMRNNVFYNWAGNGCYGGEGMKVNIVNNYYKPGPATDMASAAVKYRIAGIGIRTTQYVTENPSFKPMEHVWGKYYVNGNVVEGNEEVSADNWEKGIYEQIRADQCDGLYTQRTKDTIRLNEPLETGIITTHSAIAAYGKVLDYAGCCLYRDKVDNRIISDTRNRTATYTAEGNKPGYINSQTEVKESGEEEAWPALPVDTGRTITDTDGDGIPDNWETSNGLNPNNASDGNATMLSPEGYTNLEVYMNSLVAHITENQSKDGESQETTETTELSVTPETLKGVYDTAPDGAVLLLSAGEYTQTIGIPADRSITLRAAKGAMPVLRFGSEISGKEEKAGTLVFDGLTIEPGGVNYFISLSNGASLKSLQFRNCHIKTSKRGLMTISGKGVNDELIIDGCIVNPDKATGYSYIYNNGGATRTVIITNSTFYNYPQEHLFWIRNYGETLDFRFVFEQNTVYKWSKDSKYALCKIEEKNFTGSSAYIFRNNIVAEPFVEGKTPFMLDTQGRGTLLAEKNLIVNYGGYSGANLQSSVVNDLVLGEGTLSGMSTIGFSDPGNGDFTIYSVSPLATASTAGGVIGDPRWLKQAATLYTLTTGLTQDTDEQAGSVSIASGTQYESGTSVTVKATRYFGYVFVAWVDDKGTVLSTEAEYTFTMDSNKTVKARFEAIDVFSLHLNVSGAGKYGNVLISPAGKDGEYKLYETGTEVVLTAVDNRVIKFSNWENGSTNKERILTMDADKHIGAVFAADEYIAGWDFSDSRLKAPFSADYLSNPEQAAILSIFDENGNRTGGKIGFRHGKNGVQMNQPQASGRGGYYELEFSAKGFRNIKVCSSLLAYYFSYLTQKIQYAVDEGDFRDIRSVEINATSWTETEVALPDDAAGADKVRVRWYPDKDKSSTDFPTSGNELMLADVYVVAEEVKDNDSTAPVLRSSIPTNNAAGASATGQIVLTFDERVQAGNGNATLNGEILNPTFTNKTVTYAYSGLEYETHYEFVLPPGAIVDGSGNPFDGLTIRFTTMSRPSVKMKVYDFVVAADGTGDGTTIQSAFDAAAQDAGRQERFRIFVKNGTYDAGTDITELRAKNVSLIGQSREGVIIRNKNGTGISTSSTIHIERNVTGFYAQDLTICNAYDYKAKPGVAVALYDRSDKSIYRNVKLLSHQDTQVTGVDVRQYYEDCEIHGTVDFICGGGDIYFNRALLYLEERSGNVIAAPSTSPACKYGYVFDRCTIDGASVNNHSYALGRPWQSAPRAVYLNTTMNVIPKAEGWSEMMKEGTPALFAEYNSVDADGYAVNLSGRKKIFNNTPVAYNPVLTPEEAAAYTVSSVLGGSDAWQPMLATEQTVAPVLSESEGILSWQAVPYALNYVVVRDGVVVGITTSVSFKEVLESGVYEYVVYASNEHGGLGKVSNKVSVISTGTSVEPTYANEVSVYVRDGRTIVVKGLSGENAVEIYSYEGVLFDRVQTRDEEVTFRMPAGNYIVRVGGGGKTHVRKVLVI